MDNKGFAPILILLIVVLIMGIGGYVWWNNSEHEMSQDVSESQTTTGFSDTSKSAVDDTIPNLIIPGWQTYTNSTIGFTLEYPTDWEVYEMSSSEYYHYVTFYPYGDLDGLVSIEVASSLTDHSICSSQPCSPAGEREVQIGSTTKTVDLYWVDNMYGKPFYSFLTWVERNNDDEVEVLVKYGIPQHIQGIDAMLATFSFQ